MIKRILVFAKRFLMPHIGWLIASLLTGLLTAAASGLGVPLLIKFVFPLVFYSGAGEKPLLWSMCPRWSLWTTHQRQRRNGIHTGDERHDVH
ncbi:MAG: hypothetical protein IJ993_07580, partial [Akkermansia sp.]|nr:hypothetical protein [Akkermansia sp.]